MGSPGNFDLLSGKYLELQKGGVVYLEISTSEVSECFSNYIFQYLGQGGSIKQ